MGSFFLTMLFHYFFFATLLFSSVLSDGVGDCGLQADCLHLSFPSHTDGTLQASCGPSGTTFEVCMIWNRDGPCLKDGPSISHSCPGSVIDKADPWEINDPICQ